MNDSGSSLPGYRNFKELVSGSDWFSGDLTGMSLVLVTSTSNTYVLTSWSCPCGMFEQYVRMELVLSLWHVLTTRAFGGADMAKRSKNTVNND